jgi:hypothetical protein
MILPMRPVRFRQLPEYIPERKRVIVIGATDAGARTISRWAMRGIALWGVLALIRMAQGKESPKRRVKPVAKRRAVKKR